MLRTYGKDFLEHVHFAAPALGQSNERDFAHHADEWDYQPFADALPAIPCDGRISIKTFCRGEAAPQLTQALAVMHTVFQKKKG